MNNSNIPCCNRLVDNKLPSKIETPLLSYFLPRPVTLATPPNHILLRSVMSSPSNAKLPAHAYP